MRLLQADSPPEPAPMMQRSAFNSFRHFYSDPPRFAACFVEPFQHHRKQRQQGETDDRQERLRLERECR